MNTPTPEFARQMVNAIRMLAVDEVKKAKSGPPGAPMGMADIAEVPWNRHLQQRQEDLPDASARSRQLEMERSGCRHRDRSHRPFPG